MTYFRDGFGDFGADAAGDIGRALQEALARGEAGVQGVASQATSFYNDWVAKYGNKSTGELAQYFFMQGTEYLAKGAGVAAQLGANAQTTAQIQSATDAAAKAFQAGMKVFSGEGGTMDKIKAANDFLQAAYSFAGSVGANEDVIEQLGMWTQTAASCTTMIMGAGPMWWAGALGCTGQVLLNALSLRAGAAQNTPQGVPAAYLVLTEPALRNYQTDVTQQTIVARDAQLLAQVLHYHYGLQSTRPLYDALAWRTPWAIPLAGVAGWLDGEPPAPSDDEIQLWGRTVQVFRQYNPTSNQIPAVDLRSMLLAVTALDQHVHHSVSESYSALHGIAKMICANDWDEACRCSWTLPIKDGFHACGSRDLPSEPDLLAAHYYTGAGLLNQIGIATGASVGRGLVAMQKDPSQYLPFVRVDELINYFIAASLNLKRQPNSRWELERNRLLAALPVRFCRVRSGGKEFSPDCWTMLNIMSKPHGIEYSDPNRLSAYRMFIEPGNRCTEKLAGRLVDDNDVEAQREYAAIRLMAAFSYLLWSYKIGSIETTAQTDIIANIARGGAQPGTVAHEVQMPCDPRQIVWINGVWKANTWGGRGPWDAAQGAIVQLWHGATNSWGQPTSPEGVPVAGKFYASGAARSHTTRDGWWLRDWIKVREASWQPIIAEALRAAASAAPASSVQISLASRLPTTVIGTQMELQPQIQQMLASGALKTRSQAEQDCIAGGGYMAVDGCRPSAALEQACRDNGGTPTWDPVTKFRCPGSPLTVQQLGQLSLQVGAKQVASGVAPTPGTTGGGGGIGSIALIAGAALLLTKLMK